VVTVFFLHRLLAVRMKEESYTSLPSAPALECYRVTFTVTISLVTKHHLINSSYDMYMTVTQFLSFIFLEMYVTLDFKD